MGGGMIFNPVSVRCSQRAWCGSVVLCCYGRRSSSAREPAVHALLTASKKRATDTSNASFCRSVGRKKGVSTVCFKSGVQKKGNSALSVSLLPVQEAWASERVVKMHRPTPFPD